jgi:hypothetical protein
MTTACNYVLLTYLGVASMYVQHMCYLLREADLVNTFQSMCLGDYDRKVDDKDRQITELEQRTLEL